MKNLAPIVVFACNRPEHLYKLLKSLEINPISRNSDIYFYIDQPQNSKDNSDNNKTIDLVNEDWDFKNKFVIVREFNFGLQKNIIDGVTDVISEHGKAIILEDDLEVSSDFLNFMNESLNKYQNDKDVWHVTGFNYKIPAISAKGSFFTTHMNCWGWGTWDDRWVHIQNNMVNKIHKNKIKKFNFGNLILNNYNQLILNEKGQIKTWAIYWYQTIFLNHGLCLMPNKSLVYNNGFDGSGIHTSKSGYKLSKLNHKKVSTLPNKIKESLTYKFLLKYYFFKLRLKDFVTYHLRKLFSS